MASGPTAAPAAVRRTPLTDDDWEVLAIDHALSAEEAASERCMFIHHKSAGAKKVQCTRERQAGGRRRRHFLLKVFRGKDKKRAPCPAVLLFLSSASPPLLPAPSTPFQPNANPFFSLSPFRFLLRRHGCVQLTKAAALD